MKSFTVFIIAISINISFGQVGINTNAPKEKLHIGNNSSITIDGLNSTNNVNNLGLDNTGL